MSTFSSWYNCNDFDIIFDHLSRIFQLFTTPHAPRDVIHPVTMLIGCVLVLAIRFYVRIQVGLALLLVSAYLVDYRAVPHPTSLGSGTLSQMLGKVASGLHIADRDSKADIAFTQSVFLSHTRVEENFIRDNTDPALTHPPDCEPPINVIGM